MCCWECTAIASLQMLRGGGLSWFAVHSSCGQVQHPCGIRTTMGLWIIHLACGHVDRLSGLCPWYEDFRREGTGLAIVGRISGFWPFGTMGCSMKNGRPTVLQLLLSAVWSRGGWELFHSACIVAVCPSIHPSIHLFHQSIHLFIHYFCCSQTVTNLKLQALSSFHNILTYCNRYGCS